MFGITLWMLPDRGVSGLRAVAPSGIGLVHLDRRDVPNPTAAAEVRRVAEDLGVVLGGFSIVDIETVGYRDMPRCRDAISEGVEQAAALGVDFVYLPAFGAAEIHDVATMEAMQDLLRHALEVSEGSDLIVGSENSLDQTRCRRLLETVDDSRIRLLFDTQNPALWGHDATQVAAAVVDLIGPFVHVKDGHGKVMGNARIGCGDAEVATTITALEMGGFGGCYVLENDYRAAGLDATERDIELLAALIDDPGA